MKEVQIKFKISKKLAQKIDKTIDEWSFTTRSEFFRFCAYQFLINQSKAMPANKVLKEYSRTLRAVKTSRWYFRETTI